MEFTEPPTRTRKGQASQHWKDVTETLRNKPQEWALVGNFSPAVATHIRNGKFPAFLDPADPMPPKTYIKTHWEITSRRTLDNRTDIFIRWIG